MSFRIKRDLNKIIKIIQSCRTEKQLVNAYNLYSGYRVRNNCEKHEVLLSLIEREHVEKRQIFQLANIK